MQTKCLSSTNCASKKTVRALCAALRDAGYLEDFDTYAEQVAAVRADVVTWPKCYCQKRVNMFNGIFRTFCSRKCGLAAETTKEKMKNTCVEKYGVSHHWAKGEHRDSNIQKYIEQHGVSPQACGLEKRLETWDKKYGCHPMQVPHIFKKAFRNRMKTKMFQLPSGKYIELMGHEPHALKYVLDAGIFKEGDFDFDDVPVIQHSGNRKYFPDFWLPQINLLVEVKSQYTAFSKRYLECNIIKQRAAIASGFSFELWLWDPKHEVLTVKPGFQ